MINENSTKNVSYKYNVQINCYVFYLLRKRRCCRDIYDKIVPVNEIIVPKNWINNPFVAKYRKTNGKTTVRISII